MYYHWQTIWGGGGEAGLLGGEASPLPPPVDRTLPVLGWLLEETVSWLLKHNQHSLDTAHISLSSTIQIIYHHILLYIQYSDLWHTLDLIMCIKTMYACMCSLHAGICVHLCQCVCTLIKVHVHICEYMYCMCEYTCKQGVVSSSNTQNYNNTNIINTAKLLVHVTRIMLFSSSHV